MEIITLRDSAAGTSAKILPGIGMNCFSFVAVVNGEPIEVLWSNPEFAGGETKPSHSGIPLLFPFAGRLRGTSFRFGGREYPVEEGDNAGNAIHGFVIGRQWRVIDIRKPDASARESPSARQVTGEFQASIDAPELLDNWPADFRIRATYRLTGNELACRIEVQNPDRRPLPFGFGQHAYFRLPLGRGGRGDDCRLTVPVGESWELERLLTTGRHGPSDIARQLSDGMTVGQTQLDNVFGDLKYAGGVCTTTIHDPASGRTVTMTFGDEFRYLVLYNPPHREAICIEPYTTLPDAFRLGEQGIDTGLRILQPGESFAASFNIRVE